MPYQSWMPSWKIWWMNLKRYFLKLMGYFCGHIYAREQNSHYKEFTGSQTTTTTTKTGKEKAKSHLPKQSWTKSTASTQGKYFTLWCRLGPFQARWLCRALIWLLYMLQAAQKPVLKYKNLAATTTNSMREKPVNNNPGFIKDNRSSGIASVTDNPSFSTAL